MFRTNTNETCLQPWLPNYSLDIDRVTENSCTENTVTDLDWPQSSSAGNEIFSIAPGEGKHPVHFMTDRLCEEMAFPTLFPTGKFGFQVKRDVRLSPAKYFNELHWKICNKSRIFVFLHSMLLNKKKFKIVSALL